jgi:hypothetical protein
MSPVPDVNVPLRRQRSTAAGLQQQTVAWRIL